MAPRAEYFTLFIHLNQKEYWHHRLRLRKKGERSVRTSIDEHIYLSLVWVSPFYKRTVPLPHYGSSSNLDGASVTVIGVHSDRRTAEV